MIPALAIWLAALVPTLGLLAAAGAARYWHRQARYDPLTGLPGRDRLRTLARRARPRSGPVGVLLLDVDRFKQVNDTYGHRAGDALLTVIARRLRAATGRGEVPVRLHGDEFAVWLGRTDPEASARRAREVARALTRPVCVDGHQLVVTASVGHTTSSYADTVSLAELLHQADQAMYRAKHQRHTLASLPTTAPADRLRDLRKDAS
ncbi:diguanylate cyclase (GGDEF) domain-containing protein [Haloechinothrix alba]|uniref:Diguanylate cyclase (GGDEF) domain-containing protein n=1 Tax=Haloechinothrix alba TaxID=664784 RepID=A0A238V3U9_9PSEU|nr:GGDEF domain-containing protein [Haloechinothrix alba]SNR29172.1 diguanylate cyclase (GGDEF) domain-containing protein [Haloechinothrix alba]